MPKALRRFLVAVATVALVAPASVASAATQARGLHDQEPPSGEFRLHSTGASLDYPSATYYPAAPSNYSAANRPTSDPINKIVIHVTQETYEDTIAIFQDPSSNVSAHYTVRSADGAVAQSVREEDIAWHAGNWNYNVTSIGIEHEGWVSEPSWFTEEMYRSSAQLAAYLAGKYNIPIDREHIIGHNEVPGADHTDPGQYWDWDRYMNLVREYSSSS